MNISMDKKYRTRDGRDVRLLCVDGPNGYPVIGLVDGASSPDSWDTDGFWCGRGDNAPADLIEYHEPDIRTIWVNVYEDGVTDPYETKDIAVSNAAKSSLLIAIAQPVTFEVKRT